MKACLRKFHTFMSEDMTKKQTTNPSDDSSFVDTKHRAQFDTILNKIQSNTGLRGMLPLSVSNSNLRLFGANNGLSNLKLATKAHNLSKSKSSTGPT